MNEVVKDTFEKIDTKVNDQESEEFVASLQLHLDRRLKLNQRKLKADQNHYNKSSEMENQKLPR